MSGIIKAAFGTLGERTAFSHRKNGFLYQRERLILIERTAFSPGLNGFPFASMVRTELDKRDSLPIHPVHPPLASYVFLQTNLVNIL